MICAMLTGENRGKLMLNFDEFPVGMEDAQAEESEQSVVDSEVEELKAAERGMNPE